MGAARTILAWLAVAPSVAWTAFRLLEREESFPSVPIVAFSQYFAAAAILPVLFALALRRRIPALVGAIAAGILIASIVPRAIGDDPPPGGVPLRVMTLNLLAGKASPAAVLDLAVRERVDLVAFQELTPAAKAIYEQGAFAQRYPQRAVRRRTGSGGSGIYARERVRLSLLPEPLGFQFRTTVATVRVAGARGVNLASIHLSSPKSDRSVLVWEREFRILPEADGGGDPVVLAGDFNATLDHRVMRDLLDTGYRDAAEVAGAGLKPTRNTAPRIPLPVTIDHVLAEERVGVGDVSVHKVPGTDHRAVIAELRLPR